MRKAFSILEAIFAILIALLLVIVIFFPNIIKSKEDLEIEKIIYDVNQAIHRAKIQKNNYSVEKSYYGSRLKGDTTHFNGGCISVYTKKLDGKIKLVVSRSNEHNSCNLYENKYRDILYAKAKSKLGIQWGYYRKKNGKYIDVRKLKDIANNINPYILYIEEL